MKVPFLIWICYCYLAQISFPTAAATVLKNDLRRANSTPAKLPGDNPEGQRSQNPKLERQNTAQARLMVPVNRKAKPWKLADAAEKRAATIRQKAHEQVSTTLETLSSLKDMRGRIGGMPPDLHPQVQEKLASHLEEVTKLGDAKKKLGNAYNDAAEANQKAGRTGRVYRNEKKAESSHHQAKLHRLGRETCIARTMCVISTWHGYHRLLDPEVTPEQVEVTPQDRENKEHRLAGLEQRMRQIDQTVSRLRSGTRQDRKDRGRDTDSESSSDEA